MKKTYKGFSIAIKSNSVLVQYRIGGNYVSYPNLKIAKNNIRMFIDALKANSHLF